MTEKNRAQACSPENSPTQAIFEKIQALLRSMRDKILALSSPEVRAINPEEGVWMAEGAVLQARGNQMYAVFYFENSTMETLDGRLQQYIINGYQVVGSAQVFTLPKKALVVLLTRGSAITLPGGSNIVNAAGQEMPAGKQQTTFTSTQPFDLASKKIPDTQKSALSKSDN